MSASFFHSFIKKLYRYYQVIANIKELTLNPKKGLPITVLENQTHHSYKSVYQQYHPIGACNKTHFDKIKSTILILQKKRN